MKRTTCHPIIFNFNSVMLGSLSRCHARFKQPNGEKSELLTYPVDKRSVTETPSEDSIFAAAVAQFGMLLKNSEHTQNTSYGDITNRISGLACIKNNEYKSEFLTLVKKAELLKASGR